MIGNQFLRTLATRKVNDSVIVQSKIPGFLIFPSWELLAFPSSFLSRDMANKKIVVFSLLSLFTWIHQNCVTLPLTTTSQSFYSRTASSDTVPSFAWLFITSLINAIRFLLSGLASHIPLSPTCPPLQRPSYSLVAEYFIVCLYRRNGIGQHNKGQLPILFKR